MFLKLFRLIFLLQPYYSSCKPFDFYLYEFHKDPQMYQSSGSTHYSFANKKYEGYLSEKKDMQLYNITFVPDFRYITLIKKLKRNSWF